MALNFPQWRKYLKSKTFGSLFCDFSRVLSNTESSGPPSALAIPSANMAKNGPPGISRLAVFDCKGSG